MAKKRGGEKTYDEKNNRKKVPVGCRLDAGVLEEARGAVWQVGRGWTVQRIIDEGVAVILERLRKEYNGGKGFPPRPED